MARPRPTRLLLALTISTAALFAHQFHYGHIDANWNPAARTVELTVRLHADDLEALLRRQAQRPLELDRDPAAERLACAYVLSTVAIDQLRFRCIGMKVTTHAATLFLEAPAASPPRRARFHSFSTEFADQINTLQLLRAEKPVGPALTFTSRDTWKPLPP